MLHGREPVSRWRRRIRGRGLALAAVLFSLASADIARAQVPDTEYEGAAALGLALRRLGTTKRVLMIAAHPDDEQTQILSTLALGQGASVAYLSLTRGEGGQNGIGPELQEGLGLLRSEELLAARRLDGAQQFFTRAIDYGFSKSAEEAFRMWSRGELLADVVAVVRHFRPDVIVSVFSGTTRDGHGQHQAAGILATDAFEAAADPTRFPEQIEAGLAPHAAHRLFRIVRGAEGEPRVEIETGQLDPLLGHSHFQVAMASRSRHRSQDMGRALTPGPQSTELSLAASRTPLSPSAGSGIFAGIDTTLAMIAAAAHGGGLPDLLAEYEATVDAAREAFNPLHPDRTIRPLVRAVDTLVRAEELATRLPATQETVRELRRAIATERRELEEALLLASGVEIDAIGADETVVPGQRFELELSVWNGGAAAVGLTSLEPRLPPTWTATPRDDLPPRLEPGALVSRRFDVLVPDHAEPSEPYFLELPRETARYVWPAGRSPVGVPFEPDPVGARAELRIDGVPVEAAVTASHRQVDPRSGEFRLPLRVVPAISLTMEPRLAIVPLARAGESLPLSIRVVTQEPGGIEGTIHVDAPAGWSVEPAVLPLTFSGQGEERTLELAVRPPDDARAGRHALTASYVDARGRRFDEGYTRVSYPHIRPRSLYRDATIDVQVIDVELAADLAVGYIAAVGDEVPNALARLGVGIELLDPDQLATAPLERFDVIVVGIRAYEGRPDLVTHNARLLEYVRRGGTMIVQYNQYEYAEPGIAPYPLTMARPHDRVTDEGAAVTLLDREHPVFTFPNRITAADFEGWVQERGLYFPNQWDEAYTPLLQMADPGEAPKRGALLVADYGAGTYVYTGLALFRQLPAGVAGAYRLFANLLALGADR